MIRIWKENIWWGNTTFKKPTYANHGLILSVDKAKEITNANIIWQSYNRGTIQLDTPDNELWTYLENVEEGKHYFLYPNKTLSKSKNKIVYEVIPDVWINEIVRKQITGILKLTSNEDNVVKNNNLTKPVKTPLEIEEQELPNISLYFSQVKYINAFSKGEAHNVLSGKGDSFLHWHWDDGGVYQKEIKAVAYPLNRWLDGTQLPPKYNDYYVLGGKISGITSNKGFELEGKQDNGNIFLEDQVFWKKYNLSGMPVNNEFKWISDDFKPNDPEWMENTIMTTSYNNQTEIHVSQGYTSPKEIGKRQQTTPFMIKWLFGSRENDFTEGFLRYSNFKVFLTRVWKIDKPFNADFKYNDVEWVLPLTMRQTNGVDTEYYMLRANIWNLFNLTYTPIYAPNDDGVRITYDIKKEEFKTSDDEYLISADEKIIFFRGHWIMHKSLINVDSINRLTLEVNNDVNYVIQFRDGETIELPYGTNIFDWQLDHKENGTILKYEIVNSHYWKGYSNYTGNIQLQQDINRVYKNVKIFKDDANLLDRQLKYTQLQLAQQENKFNQLKFSIEEKSRVGSFVGGVLGNVAGLSSSIAMTAGSALTGNVAGAVAGTAGITSSIQNLVSSSVNFHYDSTLRQEQFNLAQNQYAFKKQTMERELEKLNPKNNITNDWTEYMKWMRYGDDGFIIWELRPSAESRSLYNVYKESVGLETNDPYVRTYSLDNAGVYQFSEFTEWSPYNSEEIKHILTNPILVS